MTEPLHRQEFPVHSYEVDTEGLLAPRALCAFLQEAAGGDAARGGYTMERLAEEGLVWVIQWLGVEVERYPGRGETLTVTTWARPFGDCEHLYCAMDECPPGRSLCCLPQGTNRDSPQ